jgi:hypothetical protein
MKNLHVLPTDKRSILSDCENYKHVYITSDEKFVRDEYVTDGIEVIKATPKLVNAQGLVSRRNWRKIILTIDQDLIADGIQAIDHIFLEWFVENPICEEVEVERGFLTFTGWVKSKETVPKNLIRYKIIIPQEEPKQEPLSFPPFDKEKADVITKEGQKVIRELRSNIQQETLEEAARRYTESTTDNDPVRIFSFIEGAKWQAERMYSEEDMKESFINGALTDLFNTWGISDKDMAKEKFDVWFEQFKNKGGDK